MKKILVIDINKTTPEIIKRALQDEYIIVSATSGRKALKYLETENISLILLDITTPEIDGRDTLKKITSNEKWRHIPTIVLTWANDSDDRDEVEYLQMGAADFIDKSFAPQVIKSRVARSLELEAYHQAIRLDNAKKGMQLEQMKSHLIMVLADVISNRHDITGVHIRRVSMMVEVIIKKMYSDGMYPDFLDERYVQNICLAAPIYDIGKIKIPDSILKKDGDLTEDEFELMKTHTMEGSKILAECAKDVDDNQYLLMGKDMAEYHHEWWNGKGYPHGIKGKKIPFCARVIAVADVFDALVTKHSYRDRFSFDEAFDVIKRGSGVHFDPEVVSVFLELRPEIEKILLRLESSADAVRK